VNHLERRPLLIFSDEFVFFFQV